VGDTTPFTDPATGATFDVGTTSDGGVVYIPTGDTPGDPLYIPPVDLTLDFSNTDWGTADLGFVNIDYDALQALIDSFAQPSTPADTGLGGSQTDSAATVTGGGGCFLFGTKITMADGSLKNIEDLKLGDELLTFKIPGLEQSDNVDDWYPKSKWSTDSTDNFTKTTTKVSHMRTGPFWRHYIINGQYRVTYEHMIFAKRGDTYQFIRVDGLQVGDYFLDANKNEIEIINIEQVYVMSSTVELDVEENDMYFADGILVHNFYSDVYGKY
jgi:hypothetical protein